MYSGGTLEAGALTTSVVCGNEVIVPEFGIRPSGFTAEAGA